MPRISSNFLPSGFILTITADVSSSGTVRRLASSGSFTTSYSPSAIAASSTTVVGPFTTDRNYEVVSNDGELTYTITKADLATSGTGDTLRGTAPSVTNPAITDGSTNLFVKTLKFPVDGAALHAAVLPVIQFPAAAVILRAVLDITTVATAACTIDCGYTSVSGTTTSDTLIDGIDANAAAAVFDSMDAALDSGSNAHAQKAASGKWITIDEKTGDSTGLVANLYVQYLLA